MHYNHKSWNLKIIYYLLNHCSEIFFDNSDTNIALLHLKPKIKDISLSPFRLYSKKAHSFENLSEEEYRVFIQPISNKNIINQKADKENTVVILHWDFDVKKMEQLLAILVNLLEFNLIRNTKLTRSGHLRLAIGCTCLNEKRGAVDCTPHTAQFLVKIF